MPLFDEGFRAEAARLEKAVQQRRAADLAVRDLTPQIASRIREVGQLYPWLNTGLAYSLGRFFDDSTQDELLRIAGNAALVARHDPEAYAQIISQQDDGTVKAGDVKKAPGFMGRVTSLGKGALRGVTAAMNMPVEAGEGAYRYITDVDSPMEGLKRAGGVAQFFQSPILGTTGLGGTGGRDAADAVVRQTEIGTLGMTVADNVRDKGVTGAFSDIDTGSGFFMGGKVKEAQVAKQREFGTITYPDGSVHARSIGRDVAGLFSEPGTKPYTVASGFVDLIKQVEGGKVIDSGFKSTKMAKRGMDLGPGKRAAAAVADAIRTGEAPKITSTDRLLDSIGAMRGRGIYTVDPRRAESWLSSEQGGKLTAKLAEIVDPLVMDRLTGGRLPADVLRDLVDTTDPTEMTRVLRGHLGVDIRQMPKVGRWQELGLEMRKSRLYTPALKRFAEAVPEQVVPLDDEREFLTQIRRWGANVKLGDDRISDYMQRALAVKGDFDEFARADRRAILDGLVQEAAVNLRDDLAETRPWLRRFAGQTEDEIDSFVKKLWGLESRNRPDASVMYWVDANGKNRSFIGASLGVDPKATAAWDARIAAGDAARASGSRNPWELTKAEFAGGELGADVLEAKKGQLAWDMASAGPLDKAKLAEHKAAVIEALESGKAVPREVLDEYPDLQRAFAPSADGLIDMPRRATPSNDADLARMAVPMPDVRTIRRTYDDPLFRATMKLKGVEGIEEMALRFQERWWKPTSILRVATMLRITLDSQMRMAHDNVTSIFHHPLDYITMALADTKLGSKVISPRFMVDAQGNPLGQLAALQDGFADLMTGSERSRNVYREGKKVITRDYAPLGRKANGEFDPGFFDAWHDNMASLHSSQVGKLTLASRDVEQAQEFFWKNMAGWREEFAKRLPGWTDEMATAEGRAKLLADGAVHGDEITAGHLLTRAGSDAYIADQWERMLHVTLGDPELRKAALEGVIDFGDTAWRFNETGGHLDELGNPVQRVSMSAGHGARDPRFTAVLEDRFSHLIDKQRFVGAQLIEDTGRKTAWNRATDWMFEHLYAATDNSLNRVPAYRQYVWRRIEEMSPYLRGDDADELIDAAMKAGIDKSRINQIRASIGTANHPERIDIAELNAIAKGHALTDVKDLLFDLHERSQFFDALRLIAPFGEAWREVMVRWPKYAVENPNVLRKVGLARQVGMDPEAAELVGADQWETNEETGEREHRGLVYKNTFGELMFAYPMSAQMLGMVGLPEQPMVGRVAGLNVGFEALPGVGPLASIPLAKLLPDNAAFDGFRDLVFPYGEPKGGVVDRGSQVFLPGWLRKIVDTDVRGMAATTMDAIRYRSSTGEFNVSGEGASPEEVTRLEAKAKRDAVLLSILRGVGQFVLPSSPTYEPQVQDKDAQTVMANTLARRLQQIREEHPDDYVQRFLDEHGQAAFATLQGDTTQVSPGGGLPPTKAAYEWLQKHGGVREEYEFAYGFFAPQGGDLDMDTYQRTIAWGERRQIDPKTLVELGNAMVARSVYYQVRDDVEARNKAAGRKSLTPTQSLQLYGIRQELEKRYPGYSAEGDPIPGTVAKATPEQVIDQLKRAVNDERLADSPVTKPMQDYLAALKVVEEKSVQHLGDGKVQGRPESWVTSTKPYAQSLRKALYDYGSALVEENPDFSSAWEMVFLRQFDTQLAKDGV